jgi:hypothetical protein
MSELRGRGARGARASEKILPIFWNSALDLAPCAGPHPPQREGTAVACRGNNPATCITRLGYIFPAWSGQNENYSDFSPEQRCVLSGTRKQSS